MEGESEEFVSIAIREVRTAPACSSYGFLLHFKLQLQTLKDELQPLLTQQKSLFLVANVYSVL